jgi:hypothetical protein
MTREIVKSVLETLTGVFWGFVGVFSLAILVLANLWLIDLLTGINLRSLIKHSDNLEGSIPLLVGVFMLAGEVLLVELIWKKVKRNKSSEQNTSSDEQPG